MMLKKSSLLILIVVLSPLINIGIDIYIPSLPAITQYFQTSEFIVKSSVLVFLLSYGITQPFLGPVTDLLGRRKFFLISIAGLTLTSISAALCNTIVEFYLMRLLQGVFATSIAIVTKAIILDAYEGKGFAKATNYYTMAWAGTPIIAPFIGSYLQHFFNWQASFYFIAVYGVIGFFCCYIFLPETQSKQHQTDYQLLQSFRELLNNRVFVAGILFLVCEYTILVVFYLNAPFLLQQKLKISVTLFGKIMMLVGVAYIIGGFINRLLLQWLSPLRIVFSFSLLGLCITLSMLWLALTQTLTLTIFVIPIMLLFIVDGAIYANSMTTALIQFRHIGGTASALLGGLLTLGAVITSAIIGLFPAHNMLLFAVSYTAIIIAMLLIYWFLFRPSEKTLFNN